MVMDNAPFASKGLCEPLPRTPPTEKKVPNAKSEIPILGNN